MGERPKYGPVDRRKQARDPGKTERRRSGRVEYDATGNPVWVEFGSRSRDNVMDLLLGDQSFDLADEQPRGGLKRIQPNPGGTKKGYDPYDSGQLDRKREGRKKNLRALSKWIMRKKRFGAETDEDR